MYFDLQNSPTLALLHKHHAGIFLSFFYRAFKEHNTPEVPEERLVGRWEAFVEEDVAQSDWEGEAPSNSTKFYLEEWCRNRWLARHYDEPEETYVYRLTAHAEQAVLFVDQHLHGSRRSFVGTESNFSKILQALAELNEKTQSDPKVREVQLLAEREKIDLEIIELRRTGKPQTLDNTAVKSRIYDLLNMAGRFLADFRSVEDSFRKQRDEIQNLYLEQERSPGDIIASAIDAVELLKDSDEGRSFYGFQRMLRSAEDVDRLRELIEHGVGLADKYKIEASALQGLVGQLLAERNRTQNTLSTITRQLHIVVEESFRRERRLLLNLTTDIKKHAHMLRAQPPEQITTVVDQPPEINQLMGIRFFEKRDPVPLNTTITSGAADDLTGFFRGIGPDLRLEQILQIIRDELEVEPQVSLSALVARHPLKFGSIDLLCYIFASGKNRHHQVLDERIEVQLSVEPNRVARLPDIIFQRGK